jgi:hypothetical protein
MTDIATMDVGDMGQKRCPGIVEWGADMVETWYAPLVWSQLVIRV